MTAYVALVRAVNVSGTGKLSKEDLKAMGEACGFENARTFINSGNLLFTSDLDEVLAFYERAYPGTWFEPRMLETRRYVGIRDGELLCVAGVHVWSPAWRVAALGNVATLPEARGRGLATTACADLCRLLLDDGIEVIALNVRADNRSAILAYERLGFAHAADYVEVPLQRD